MVLVNTLELRVSIEGVVTAHHFPAITQQTRIGIDKSNCVRILEIVQHTG
jgi:hypothetical protein